MGVMLGARALVPAINGRILGADALVRGDVAVGGQSAGE